MPRRTKVHIFKQLPADFAPAYRAAHADGRLSWVLYHKQYLTADDVRELRTLWRLTRDVDLLCQRLHEMVPGGCFQVTLGNKRAAQQPTITTGGQTNGE